MLRALCRFNESIKTVKPTQKGGTHAHLKLYPFLLPNLRENHTEQKPPTPFNLLSLQTHPWVCGGHVTSQKDEFIGELPHAEGAQPPDAFGFVALCPRHPRAGFCT